MPIPHYGVWVGRPTRYTAQRAKEDPKSPHIHLKFTDGSSKEFEAAINVKSTDIDSRLVFWLADDFSNPSIIEQLSKLDEGFHLAQWTSENNNNDSGSNGHPHNRHHQARRLESDLRGLDFIRTNDLVNIRSGQVLPHDIPGENNDILDKMEPILQNAIGKSTTYIFGSSFGSGIHDVHMNQGSLPRFDNGIYEDGAVLFKYDDGHWGGVFLAFASQRIPTNTAGEPERDSDTLADILGH